MREWRTKLRRDAGVAARDSYEYAVLACKRWRFLHMQSLTPESLPALLASLKHDQAQELGIAIALLTSGPPATVLGIAFVRCTRANNLILEFLAGAPGNTDTIKGCGSVLMQTLARIAASLHCRELWGECTALSQGFYIQTKRRAGNQAVRNQEPDAITAAFSSLARNCEPCCITPPSG